MSSLMYMFVVRNAHRLRLTSFFSLASFCFGLVPIVLLLFSSFTNKPNLDYFQRGVMCKFTVRIFLIYAT